MIREYIVKEEGYTFGYISSENVTFVNVYFDEVSITHTKTNIVQYNESYTLPFIKLNYQKMKLIFVILYVYISCICCGYINQENDSFVKIEHIGISDQPLPNIFISLKDKKKEHFEEVLIVDTETFDLVDNFVKNNNTGVQRYAVDDYAIYNVIRFVDGDSSNYVLTSKDTSVTYFKNLKKEMHKNKNSKAVVDALSYVLSRIE